MADGDAAGGGGGGDGSGPAKAHAVNRTTAARATAAAAVRRDPDPAGRPRGDMFTRYPDAGDRAAPLASFPGAAHPDPMQKIVPNLWFADAAAGGQFYAEAFPGSRVRTSSFYPEQGLLDFQKGYAGKPLTVDVEIDGYRLMLINAGDMFRPNPSISFTLSFAAADTARLDALWTALADGGRVLMPLQEYPYSERYGWVEDRFGVSWQLTVAGDQQRPPVMPTLLFSGPAQNRARAAIEEYTALFPDADLGAMVEYPEQTGPADAGAVMYADFTLAGQWFTAMDSAAEESHPFTEGVSLQVECADQAEIDRYWAVLSHVPEAEQCGWCKDRFGVSWQIVPGGMADLITSPAAYAAMMEMHKIDIAALWAAAS